MILAAVVSLVLVTTGCAVQETPAAQPTATPAVTPSETPKPEPVAERVLVGGLSFSIEFDDGSTADYPYSSDADAAITALSRAFASEPEVSESGEVQCTAPYTLSEWDGFMVFSNTEAPAPGQVFRVFAQKGAPLEVETTNGSVLGGDNSAVIESTDDALKDSFENKGATLTTVYFDVQDLVEGEVLYDETGPASDSVDGKFAWGGTTFSRDGIVERISAPTLYLDC